jgi:hypothetical protein
MPYPLQPDDAAERLARQDAINRAAHTAANSGPLPAAVVPMYPAQSLQMLSTSSTTYVTLWQGLVLRSWPTLSIAGSCSAGAGSTGDLRVLVDGVQVGAVTAIPAVFTFWSLDREPLAPGALAEALVQVQARVLTGAGPVSIGMRSARNEP